MLGLDAKTWRNSQAIPGYSFKQDQIIQQVSTHYQLRGMAMQYPEPVHSHTIGIWQPFTAASSLLGLISIPLPQVKGLTRWSLTHSFTAEESAKMHSMDIKFLQTTDINT